jgi:hypothetical protein
MTATLRAPAPTEEGLAPVRKKRSWRWLRLVIPFVVVALAVIGSGTAYLLEQPDQRDAAYLSPVSGAGIGARHLADALRQRNITVERQTRTSDALVSAYRGDATLFLPAPDLVNPFYLRMLKLMPATTRIVLVEPGSGALNSGHQPIAAADRRLAAHAVAAGCALAAARDAGAAAVQRSTYSAVDPKVATELDRCYGGSLVVFSRGPVETTVVGAADPFRNDRIAEHHNERLVLGLLARAPRLVWLDLHRNEPQPGYVDNPALAGGPAAPPSLGPGSPDPDFPLRGSDQPGPGDNPPSGGRGNGGGGNGSGPDPLTQAFPPWLFGAAALTALAALLLALASARRLGAPIAEPLPITVRATETIEGRGRLYQRAKARAPALEALRGAARERLAHLLDLGAGPDRAALVAAAAVQSGWAPETVDLALFGAPPGDDQSLVRAAVLLETLMAAVTSAEKGDLR